MPAQGADESLHRAEVELLGRQRLGMRRLAALEGGIDLRVVGASANTVLGDAVLGLEDEPICGDARLVDGQLRADYLP
jgi:hypothetical protein